MKTEITITKEFDLKVLQLKAGVRYWEDSEVNGVADETGDLIPCRSGDLWCPIIDIDTGVITNWEKGKTAEIHYKVCDQCSWDIIDDKGEIVQSVEDEYVPYCLGIEDSSFGDYIIFNVDENGKINNWKFNPKDFQRNDD